MFIDTEADADAIRKVFHKQGEISAGVEAVACCSLASVMCMRIAGQGCPL